MPARNLSSRLAAILLLAMDGACADDERPSDGEGSSSADESSTGTSSDPDTSTTQSGDESESSGSDSTGEPEPCVPTELPGPLGDAVWDERSTVAGLAGRDGVTPIAWDLALHDGAMVVGGYFRWADGEFVEALARHDDDGWSALAGWNELAPSGFTAVGVGPNGELAAATNDLAQQGDGEIWVDLGEGPESIATHSGAIRRLLWIDDALWAVGYFELADATATSVATWNGETWSPVPGGDPDGPVFDIAIDANGDLLFAGEFTQIGGTAAQRVARFDGESFTALDVPDSARVIALEFDDDGTLWAGGVFVLAEANQASASLARWTGAAWELAAGGVAFGEYTGVVSDLLWVDGAMHVAGCFDAVGADHTVAGGIARLVDDVWEPLGDGPGTVGSAWFGDLACGFEPNPGAVFSIPVQRLHHDGTRLWAAGNFAGMDHVPSQSVAVMVDDAWQSVDTPGLGISGTLDQLAMGEPTCEVYGLASGSHAGGEPLTSRVVRWDPRAGWASAAPELPPGSVCTEIEGGPWITVGCSAYDPEPTGQVLRLDGDAWSPQSGVPGPVHDLATSSDGRVWVVGGDTTGYLANTTVDSLVIVEDGFDGFVSAIAPTRDDELIVAGSFTRVGDVEAVRIARVDNNVWTPLGEGLPATPSALAATADAVWAATFDEGTPDRLVLGRFDGERWEEIATPERGLPGPMGESSHTFTRLRVIGDGLVAVGYVWPDTGGRNAFFFDGESFTAIGGGIAAITVDDVLVTGDAMFFGGTIAEVGLDDDLRSSVGFARLHW